MIPLFNKFTFQNLNGTKMYTLRTFPLTPGPGLSSLHPQITNTSGATSEKIVYTNTYKPSPLSCRWYHSKHCSLPCFSLEHSIFVHKEIPLSLFLTIPNPCHMDNAELFPVFCYYEPSVKEEPHMFSFWRVPGNQT